MGENYKEFLDFINECNEENFAKIKHYIDFRNENYKENDMIPILIRGFIISLNEYFTFTCAKYLESHQIDGKSITNYFINWSYFIYEIDSLSNSFYKKDLFEVIQCDVEKSLKDNKLYLYYTFSYIEKMKEFSERTKEKIKTKSIKDEELTIEFSCEPLGTRK